MPLGMRPKSRLALFGQWRIRLRVSRMGNPTDFSNDKATTKDSRESEISRGQAETRRKATARIIPREKIPNARGRRRAGAWSSRAGRDVQVGTPEKCAGEPLRGEDTIGEDTIGHPEVDAHMGVRIVADVPRTLMTLGPSPIPSKRSPAAADGSPSQKSQEPVKLAPFRTDPVP
jgi:hypothetical protein